MLPKIVESEQVARDGGEPSKHDPKESESNPAPRGKESKHGGGGAAGAGAHEDRLNHRRRRTRRRRKALRRLGTLLEMIDRQSLLL